MGGTQSTRKLSVNNDVPIQVSEAAIKRMTESEPSIVNTLGTPSRLKDPKPEFDYSRSEDYWAKRVQFLKNTHDAINKKMEAEYDKAVSETAQMFKRAQTACVVGKLPPCQDQKASVIKCYNENSTQPLLCGKFVTDFNECVSAKRSAVMATGA